MDPAHFHRAHSISGGSMRKNLIAVMLVLFCTVALAQQTGSISGTGTEAGGGPLPGVTVEARSNVLPQPRVTTTSENGEYRFPQLPPGQYSVDFTLSGMQGVSRPAGVLLGQDTKVNAQ